jgi:16S rRNA (guanine527-N7)-methyltransferase
MQTRGFRGNNRNGKFVDPKDLLAEGLRALGLDEALAGDDQLMAYISELMNWNRVYNLTSVRKPAEIVTRHILDSLSIIPHLKGKRVLDIGTGAGLPGIPLALAEPEREYVLLDSSSKKLRFVQQTITTLGLEMLYLNIRASRTTGPMGVLIRSSAGPFQTCMSSTGMPRGCARQRAGCSP